jgi:hypothetical protein
MALITNNVRLDRAEEGRFEELDSLEFAIHGDLDDGEGFKLTATVYDARAWVVDTTPVRVELEVNPVGSDDQLLLVVGKMHMEANGKVAVIEVPVLMGQDLFDEGNVDYNWCVDGITECQQSYVTTFRIAI